MRKLYFTLYFGATALEVLCLACPVVAHAQAAVVAIDLPVQPLGASLQAIALRSGTGIVASADLVAGLTAPAVSGRYSADEAVALVLRGSGLHWSKVGTAIVISRQEGRGEAGDVNQTPAGSPEVTVTGTRIRGAAPAGSEVITIGRGDIDRSGYATTQEVLQSLPQNFGGGPNEASVGVSVRNNTTSNSGFGASINLRGLGTSSTLVLIDGNRPALGGLFGAFSDLSLIPSTAIERVEVLGDGASALYGSDAVAGVVNIRLRNDFAGLEIRARYGFADGFDEAQASQLAGLGWTTGHLTVGYEYYRRGRLSAADRSYAREDLRPFGGPDYRKTFSNPGTIVTFDGRTFAIPQGQDGTGLTASRLVEGQGNRADSRLGSDLLPKLRRHAVYASVRQEIASWLALDAQAFAADRRSTTRFIPDNYGGVVVPVTNPFYVDPTGTGQPYLLNYDFAADLGPQTATTRVKAFSGVGGAQASIGPWRLDVRGSHGEQRERLWSENIPNYVPLTAALADTSRETAYNLFGDGSFTSPATVARVRGSIQTQGRYAVSSGIVKGDGPLIGLPAGAIKLAIGGEYRREHYGYGVLDDQFAKTPTARATSGLPITRKVLAGYAELYVPVFAPEQAMPGFDRLDVSLAGRVEHYDSFGTTANPKVGVSWRPVSALTLRGSFGTSFRAPGFQETRQGLGTALYLPQPLADPRSPNGSTNALILFGNQPGIGPEKARTWTLGLDFRPANLPGLNLTATYFDIRYRDRIASLQSDYLTFLSNRTRYAALIDDAPSATAIAGFYADPNFSNPYGIAPGAIQAIVDARTSNLSSSRVQGLDFDLGYQVARGRFEVGTGVSGAYIFHIDQQILPSASFTDIVSTIGNPVDLRLRGRLTASVDGWSAAAFVNFVDGYLNTGVVVPEKVKSFATVDLNLGYEVKAMAGALRGLRVALSATNLFDRDPPYVNNPTVFSAAGFDPDNASPVGRLVALQVTKSW